MQGIRILTASVFMTGALLAQIDPSIPLRGTTPPAPNILDMELKAIQLRQMQERTRQLDEQTRQLNEQRARQEAEKQRAAAASGPSLTMRQLLGEDGFKVMGLNLLRDEQLTILDRWISLYSADLAKRFSSPGREAVESVESEINGEFHGWSGDTIFELANGQIWKQSSYDYEYEYEYNPKVVIYPIGSVFKMKVDGVKGAVEVRRLK